MTIQLESTKEDRKTWSQGERGEPRERQLCPGLGGLRGLGLLFFGSGFSSLNSIVYRLVWW